jgi:hypothetical protein
MANRDLVSGTLRVLLVRYVYSSYMLGKMLWDRIPKLRTTKTRRSLQLIHSNFCGPMLITSKNGSKFILTFIDDFSRKTWLYFLSENPQTLNTFKQFRTLVESKNSKIDRIETLRNDREGGDYLSKTFIEYYKNRGIHRQLTSGYSPHQNE